MRRDLKEDPTFYRMSAADVVLIAVILAIAGAGIVRVGKSHGHEPAGPAHAVLHSGDAVIDEIDLGSDRIVDLPEQGMQLEIRDGRIRVLESDCPQKICVHLGWIATEEQIIACVPNRVLIEIETVEEPFLDAVVY